MGICISQYRLAIGLFNTCKFVTSGCIISVGSATINIIFSILILVLLIIRSGDVELNPGPSDGPCKKLNVCHVNIRSLSRSKLKAIQVSLSKVFDIITVSETHLHQGVPDDLFDLQGFHKIIRKDRNGPGGGVAIFIKQNIIYKRLFKYENNNTEAIWVQLNTIEGKVLLCCCYRPPTNSDFWQCFNEILNDVKADRNKYIFILGDLNADFTTNQGRKLTHMLYEQNLHALINEPTRITDTTSSVLDQVITNCKNFVTKVDVLPPVSSNDHCTVSAELNFKINTEHAYKRIIWQYKDANFNDFRRALSDNIFEDCFKENNDINKACTLWTEIFLNTARTYIPNKVVTIRPKDSPWYTNSLRLMKRRLQRDFRKYKKSKTPANWNKYKIARNEYQNELDNAELNYRQSLSLSLATSKNTKNGGTQQNGCLEEEVIHHTQA